MLILFHFLFYMDSLEKNAFHQFCSHDMFFYQFDPHIYVVYQDKFCHI